MYLYFLKYPNTHNQTIFQDKHDPLVGSSIRIFKKKNVKNFTATALMLLTHAVRREKQSTFFRLRFLGKLWTTSKANTAILPLGETPRLSLRMEWQIACSAAVARRPVKTREKHLWQQE